ncbi:hypothetical protein [Nocardia sp. IFM 10818]
MYNSEQGGRLFRQAWIDGVTRHYPGTPKPGAVAPWEETPDWERAAASTVYGQVVDFLAQTGGKAADLSRDQKSRFIALLWIGQVRHRLPDAPASYLADWDEMKPWQRETDADIFEAVQKSLG